MRIDWTPIPAWRENATPNDKAYGLYLMKPTGELVKFLGTLMRHEGLWRFKENSNTEAYWLDGDLSLEEAMRAAKLFLCVGSPA